ncbi:MAG: hypothetical protein BGO26_03015 [Actinobacteria bacterium 69-20]|nr:MAG: hypothetical protein BGO26_03015 [Actinobacteria bacterium 69-20]
MSIPESLPVSSLPVSSAPVSFGPGSSPVDPPSSGHARSASSTGYDDLRGETQKVPSGDRTAFSELGLPTPLLRALRGLGYHSATDIQAAAIPALMSERDVIGVAQTGTGKTAAFGLPLLASIDPARREVQALVLVPTRELAVQVAAAIGGFAAHLPEVETIAIYGGAPFGKQIGALKRGAQVVVGTPGRVIDLIERRALALGAVRFAVLDEADEMLRMGFAEDVDRILEATPADRQTALFSATMPKEIRRVAAQHLRQPVDVSVAASATPVAAIRQSFVVLPYRDKAVALQRVLAVTSAEAAVVFVRTRSACEELGVALIGAGVNAAVISGDVTQNERERTIGRLRAGQIDVLVATDVAARGMDVERIGLVVNFDAPGDPETYTHRVGRTGRAGRTGEALTFFTPKELSRLKLIERATGRRLDEVDVPSAAEVHRHRAMVSLAAALDRHTAGNLQNYRGALRAAADRTGLPVEEIAAALLATMIDDDGSTVTDTVEARPRQQDRQRFDRDRPRFDRDRPRADRDRPRTDRDRAPKYDKRAHRAESADHAPRWKADRSAQNQHASRGPAPKRGVKPADRGTANGAGTRRHKRSVA